MMLTETTLFLTKTKCQFSDDHQNKTVFNCYTFSCKNKIQKVTNAFYARIEQVDKLPVDAEGVVGVVVRALKDVPLRASEVDIVELQNVPLD